MNYQKPKIEFYRQRSFSEKLNVTFDFIRENWKPLLKYSFYVIMPVCLIQTYAMNSFFVGIFDLASNSASFGESTAFAFLESYGVYLLCMLVGSSLISGLVYAMMQTYQTRAEGLQGVVISDFKSLLIKNFWKCFLLSLFLIFAIVALILIAGIMVSAVSLFLTIPLIFLALLCAIPLMMLVPVYIFERDISFFDAFGKAWRLSISVLGGMLLFMIVIYIISSVIQTVTMIPWYLTLFIGKILSISQESTADQSIIYKFAIYILGLIQSYGVYVASIIGVIGLAFQYFHAREKVEGITIESNIENFNNL
ncbi:MAG: hypothetical protein LBT42_00465 [Tannerella sp.]|jgi:hypothetical protein|nr:hypothetical protein [Tannerella sp.]